MSDASGNAGANAGGAVLDPQIAAIVQAAVAEALRAQASAQGWQPPAKELTLDEKIAQHLERARTVLSHEHTVPVSNTVLNALSHLSGAVEGVWEAHNRDKNVPASDALAQTPESASVQ